MASIKTMAGPGIPLRTIPGHKEILRRTLLEVEKLPDGTSICTAALLRKMGEEELIDTINMIRLDFELIKAARRKGIILDKSAYDDMTVGLPFTIPFVVKRKK